MLPDADDTSPWLPAERELLRATTEQDRVPVLGICLGAQLLAHTFGGEVRGKYGLPEKGVTELSLLPGAEDDPLLAGLPATVRAIESHQDQITRLPADAVPLMSSERCRHQMLRIGRSWGVQFHPEVTVDRVRGWDTDTLRSWGFEPGGGHRRGRAARGRAGADLVRGVRPVPGLSPRSSGTCRGATFGA